MRVSEGGGELGKVFQERTFYCFWFTVYGIQEVDIGAYLDFGVGLALLFGQRFALLLNSHLLHVQIHRLLTSWRTGEIENCTDACVVLMG